MSPRRLWFAGAIVAAAIVALGGVTLWRATSTLAEARETVSSEGNLRVTVRPLNPTLPLGLESLGAPASFSDAKVFQGHLFIAGPSGVARLDPSGALVASYRPGMELPPAPATALAVGFAGDSRSPELWIATAGEGLIAFDGRAFRHIRPENNAAAKITSLLAVPTGRILLGTEKSGVLVWDGSHLSPFHTSLAQVNVTALSGNDADLWIGTLDRGLLHWHAGALTELRDSLPDRRVLSIAMDEASGTVYVGTALGVAEVRNDAVTRVLAPGYFAQSLLVNASTLSVGTLEEGMLTVDLSAHPNRSSTPDRSRVCPECSVRRIFQQAGDIYTLADNSLWKGDEMLLGAANSTTLNDRNIAALSLDSSGRLWIGYFDRGLQILDAHGGRGISLEDDHLFCINRIVHDPALGTTAVATANGLVLLDNSTARRRVIGQAEGLIANQVSDVALRPDGSIVAATAAGLSFIDSSGISSLYAFHGLVNNHVYALSVDGSRILAGTLGGLSILDAGLVKASYTTANSSLKHNWITAIIPSGADFFVGTYGAGVLRLDPNGHWESFDDLRGNLEINTNAMTASPLAIYAGTLDRGLAVYNRGSGRWNFFTAGLPSRNVTAVDAHSGMLYIGTDNGLVKIPESSVLAR